MKEQSTLKAFQAHGDHIRLQKQIICCLRSVNPESENIYARQFVPIISHLWGEFLKTTSNRSCFIALSFSWHIKSVYYAWKICCCVTHLSEYLIRRKILQITDRIWLCEMQSTAFCSACNVLCIISCLLFISFLFFLFYKHMYLQFAEKFQEFKEAARIAKEKSHEKMELTSTPSQVSLIA